jgi:hypothetical protein
VLGLPGLTGEFDLAGGLEMFVLFFEVFLLLLQGFLLDLVLDFLFLLSEVPEIEKEGQGVAFCFHFGSVPGFDLVVEHQRHPLVDVGEGILDQAIFGVGDFVQRISFDLLRLLSGLLLQPGQLLAVVLADLSDFGREGELLGFARGG